MLHILTEDGNRELKHRFFPLGKNIRQHLQNTLDGYEGDRTINGFKRLNNILSMENGIAYNEMKRLKNFFDNYQGTPNSIEYILNGGEPMRLWINATLNRATKGVEDFKTAKKEAGIPNAYIRPHEKDRQNKTSKPTTAKIQVKNAAKDVNNNTSVKYESILRENINDEHPFYDCLTDYGCEYVLSEFERNPNGKENWGNRIDPNMYAKALGEFTTYGELYRFPKDKIHQWMGIIMRNTAILYANTQLAGHSSYCDVDPDFMEEFLLRNLGERFVSYQNTMDITVLNENGEEENTDYMEVLDDLGLFEWMKAPDGSDAWSDYGIQPIMNLIAEYNQNKTAEETLVIVNKILDIYHARGDLASLFVNGGSSALTRVTFRPNESKKRIICITEKQMRDIYNKACRQAGAKLVEGRGYEPCEARR